jgi:hypothetical protein
MLGEFILVPQGYSAFMPDELVFKDFTEFFHKAVYFASRYSKKELMDLADKMLNNLKRSKFNGL